MARHGEASREFLELTDSQGTLDIGEAVIVTQVSHLIEPGTEFFTLMEVGGNAMVADLISAAGHNPDDR